MRTLVFCEHHAGTLTRGSLGVLSMAAALGPPVSAIVAGASCSKLAGQAARHGAETVLVADDPRLADPLPQPRVDVLSDLISAEGFELILFAQSVLTSDIAAALAVRLDAGLNWDLVALNLRAGQPVGRRQALADSVVVEVGWSSPVAIALFRDGAFEPAERDGRAEIREIPVAIDEWSQRAALGEHLQPRDDGAGLERATTVVAGGLGLGSAEAFGLVHELASLLGGTVGSSGAAVEAGWIGHETQIGQSGMRVSPNLYVAAGISGAPQHTVGMRGSGTIVAINSDPDAPIFAIADLGVVGDLHEILPRLSALLRQAETL